MLLSDWMGIDPRKLISPTMRRRSGQGPHLAKTLKPRVFSRFAVGFSLTEEPGGLQFMGITKSQTRLSDEHTQSIE